MEFFKMVLTQRLNNTDACDKDTIGAAVHTVDVWSRSENVV